MNPSELIAIARALTNGVIDGGVNPATQTELRRAISCTYYAMFHTLMMSNANTLIGASPADQQRWAWQQTYRAADHRPTRNKLSSTSLGNNFSITIRRFGVVFADVQRERHAADYDPHRAFSVTKSSNSLLTLKRLSTRSTKPRTTFAATLPFTSSPPSAATDIPTTRHRHNH